MKFQNSIPLLYFLDFKAFFGSKEPKYSIELDAALFLKISSDCVEDAWLDDDDTCWSGKIFCDLICEPFASVSDWWQPLKLRRLMLQVNGLPPSSALSFSTSCFVPIRDCVNSVTKNVFQFYSRVFITI